MDAIPAPSPDPRGGFGWWRQWVSAYGRERGDVPPFPVVPTMLLPFARIILQRRSAWESDAGPRSRRLLLVVAEADCLPARIGALTPGCRREGAAGHARARAEAQNGQTQQTYGFFLVVKKEESSP